MSSLTSAINVQVDKNTKQQATNILNQLGISMSTLINATLRQVILNKGIPFDITLNVQNNQKPSKELIEALKEAKEIEKNPNKYKGYHDVDKLFEDILNED